MARGFCESSGATGVGMVRTQCFLEVFSGGAGGGARFVGFALGLEAVAEAKRAHQLDPTSPLISYLAGYIQIMARQYEAGIAVCKKFADENPTFARSPPKIVGAGTRILA
jgi:hypothetical protein